MVVHLFTFVCDCHGMFYGTFEQTSKSASNDTQHTSYENRPPFVCPFFENRRMLGLAAPPKSCWDTVSSKNWCFNWPYNFWTGRGGLKNDYSIAKRVFSHLWWKITTGKNCTQLRPQFPSSVHSETSTFLPVVIFHHTWNWSFKFLSIYGFKN